MLLIIFCKHTTRWLDLCVFRWQISHEYWSKIVNLRASLPLRVFLCLQLSLLCSIHHYLCSWWKVCDVIAFLYSVLVHVIACIDWVYIGGLFCGAFLRCDHALASLGPILKLKAARCISLISVGVLRHLHDLVVFNIVSLRLVLEQCHMPKSPQCW